MHVVSGGAVAPGGLPLKPAIANDVPLASGAWLDVVFCLAPIAFLLTVTLSKRLFMPSSRSLPYAAALLWLIKMTWIGEDLIHITATILQGTLLGLVPLSILFGAFLFFNVLMVTQTMPHIAALVRATCRNHPVAEVFLVLWAMGYLIEGASGFGTGPAMLPPILAALGHSSFESIVCLLMMTSTVGPFGSSGIGLWFGLSALDWSRAQLVKVTFLVAICMTLMSYPVAVMGARLLLSWQDLRGCWVFGLLSITACAVPALLAALFSFEAPGLLSGVLGVVFTALLARSQLGLSQQVPCMVARRLRDLEAGAAAVGMSSSSEGGDSVHQPLAGRSLRVAEEESAAPESLAKRAKSAKPGAVVRDIIELTAVALSYPAAQRRPWDQQMQQQVQQPAAAASQQLNEERTGAAQGLLQALTASSAAAARSTYRRSGTEESIPAAAMEPSAEQLAELAAATDGDAELLPARAVLSHHDLAAYRPARSSPPATGAFAGQRPRQAGASSAGSPEEAATSAYLSDRRQLALRLLPWVAMLVVVAGTRIPYLQKSNGHELRLHLRSLGDLTVSSNLVIQFQDLCRIGVNWSYAILYVPSFLPFICTGCATLFAFRHSIPADKSWTDPFSAATAKCKSVAAAIIGALILVALMVQGGRQAPSYIIGYWLSEWLNRGYIAVSMLLGGVGSFFSGSVATSNMTFGLLQQVAAQKLGLNATAMVMLQIVGGAAGQMISISNILGGRAVMGLQHIPEGQLSRRHCLPAWLTMWLAPHLRCPSSSRDSNSFRWSN